MDMLRLLLISGVIGAMIQSPAAASESIRSANGRTVTTQRIADMDCAQLAAKLAEIDATHYREPGRLPRDGRDQPLLAYERAVADAHFRRCASKGLMPTDPSYVFSSGFTE